MAYIYTHTYIYKSAQNMKNKNEKGNPRAIVSIQVPLKVTIWVLINVSENKVLFFRYRKEKERKNVRRALWSKRKELSFNYRVKKQNHVIPLNYFLPLRNFSLSASQLTVQKSFSISTKTKSSLFTFPLSHLLYQLKDHD